MALFQPSVLKKYIKQQDSESVSKAYKKFVKYFHNPSIQQNIRESKEEQYQAKFLDELFVNILGYTLNPQPKFNLTTELKNEKNAKKADGAILKDDIALGVIELKSTKTKDLEKVRQQAFDYKANQTGCVYVITSNFEKVRFYINNAVDFEEFNLFTLTEERFALMFLCLSKESLLSNTPLKIKEASIAEEEAITKKFYADYSLFKRELYRDLVKKNMKNEVFRSELAKEDQDRAAKNIKLTLFKKSQKLIDRFLFIFFSEDRGLLPPNSTLKILEQWDRIREEMDMDVPLYDRYKKYFTYLDTGRKGTDKTSEIFAYNGGLFKPDSTLDSLLIDDKLLYDHTKKLSLYDFESQVDVNILGHIFENSLNEIESVNAEIEGDTFDKQTTKRKKDGVFYTPKYITKYIVDNTIGKLCEVKKAELGIIDEEYISGRQKATKQKLLDNLESYREWLLQLTILDPACGSGAFLNQALDFLIGEHQYLDELQSKLLGGGLVFPNIENTVLENNIFGVDINEESVEIAKLSLWLRTAQPRRKLNDLSSNIKCGNSLIDSKSVAGSKAFKWGEEFKSVFDKGGFDVVIGNPPYVKRQNIEDINQIEFLEKNYESATYNFDLYLLFIEKGSQLVNENGLVSYINPSKFTSTKTGSGIRNYLDKNCHITSYIDFKEYQVFEDATTYCCIFILKPGKKGITEYYELHKDNPTQIDLFTKYEINIAESKSGLGWQFKPTVDIPGNTVLKEYVDTITGIESGADTLYILPSLDENIRQFKQYEGDILFPTLKGTNVSRYYFEKSPFYSIVPYQNNKELMPAEMLEKSFPEIWQYLVEHREALEGREKGKMKTAGWYGYVYPKNLHKYFNERLIWTDISIKPQFVIDRSKSWHVRTVCSLELNKKGYDKKLSLELLLGILNSELFFYYIKNNSNSVRGGYFRYKPQYVKEFPIPDNLSPNLSNEIISKVVSMLEVNEEFHKKVDSINNYVLAKFGISSIGKKLQKWYELEFSDFCTELNKIKKSLGAEKLSKNDEMEWMELFNTNKEEVQNIKSIIDSKDNKINRMVYELYGIGDEEIEIIENS